jgi:hypothetical protein
MSWDEQYKQIKKEAADLQEAVVGRKITAAEFVPAYPNLSIGHIHLEFDDGSSMEINVMVGGCEECNPDGEEGCLSIDYLKGKR